MKMFQRYRLRRLLRFGQTSIQENSTPEVTQGPIVSQPRQMPPDSRRCHPILHRCNQILVACEW